MFRPKLEINTRWESGPGQVCTPSQWNEVIHTWAPKRLLPQDHRSELRLSSISLSASTMYLPFSSTLPALLLSQFPSRINPFNSNGEVSALDIDRPDPPAPHGYDPLPDTHRDALAAAWGKLETQLAAPESDWTCE
jgi:hypothetical protein